MKFLTIEDEIKRVNDELIGIDMDLLDAAREEVKRRCWIRYYIAGGIIGIFLLSLIMGIISHVNNMGIISHAESFFAFSISISAISGALLLAVVAVSTIAIVTKESIVKKCDDLPELRLFAEKLAKKNTKLLEKIECRERNKQILNYLNEQLAKERDTKTEFTPIKKMVPGELRGPQELVNVLTRIREKKENLKEL